MHGLQTFIWTHSKGYDSLLFILCLQEQMLLTSAFSKENSAISLEESVLVFRVFTTATRNLIIIIIMIMIIITILFKGAI